MGFEHLRVITVVYLSALIPLLTIPILRRKRIIPNWIPIVYITAFVVCAIGWELWFTCGWVSGDPVNLCRASELNMMIPIHINWLLNSLADAGTICLGGLLLAWLIFGEEATSFIPGIGVCSSFSCFGL